MDFIHSKKEAPRIEVTPLVDIIFLLLIFFMVSSDFIKPLLKMELPKAMYEEEKLEKVDLVVTLSAESEIYVNKKMVQLDELQSYLAAEMARLGKYDVIFRGDNKIGYSQFVDILDIAKMAGATSFSIEHDKNE